MKTCRDTMRESNENLEWCRPESYLNGRVVLAINEGRVDGISIDGQDLDTTPDNIRKVAQMVNDECDLYEGQTDIQIIQDAEHKELPCRLCPWFDVCQAMDEVEDEGEEEEE